MCFILFKFLDVGVEGLLLIMVLRFQTLIKSNEREIEKYCRETELLEVHISGYFSISILKLIQEKFQLLNIFANN